MLFGNQMWTVLISIAMLFYPVSGFGIELFSSGAIIYSDWTTVITFTGAYPKLVTFKIAVQNQDKTLTSIESYNAYNVMGGTFQAIRTPGGIKPGINYFFVAVDNNNPLNYATCGPIVIHEKSAPSNPSASISANSNGVAYKTDAGYIASTIGSVSQTTNSKGVTPTTTTSTKNDIDNDGTEENHSHPNLAVIIGSAAGGLFALVVFTWILLYKCCYKKHELGSFTVTYNTPGHNVQSKVQKNKIPSATPGASTKIEMSVPKKSTVQPTTAHLSPQKQMAGKTKSSPNSGQEPYSRPYPYAHHHQAYPSYPYPQDSMPVPEHFVDVNQQQQQQFNPPHSPIILQNSHYLLQYPVNNSQQAWNSEQNMYPFLVGGYPPMADNQTSKTASIATADKLLAENTHSSAKKDKEKYQQKPDTVSDVQTVFEKPDDADAKDSYSKPHEREGKL